MCRNILSIYYLFVCSLILLPFNALPLYQFGVMSSEGAIYPLFILIVLTSTTYFTRAVSEFKVSVICPAYTKLVFIFCVYTLFVTLFNYETISSSNYMGRNGLVRFIQQYLQLILGFLTVFSIAVVLKKNKYNRFINTIHMVVFFYVIFALLQGIAYVNQGGGLEIYRAIGEYIFHDGIVDFAVERRHALHSVSQEPSMLSMYLVAIAPFIMVQSIQVKKIITLLLLSLVLLLSFSRTGYVIYTVEVFLIIYFIKYKYLNIKKILLSIIIVVPIIVVIIAISPMLDVFSSLIGVETNSSNAARYAASYSALKLWLDNNILLGVGLGQAGFNSVKYLPEWGYISGDVFDTVNQIRWPPIHNLLVRILVETGIIGLLLWLAMYYYFLVSVNKIIMYKYKYFNFIDYFGYAVFIAIVATFLVSFNRELFSNMVIWVILGVGLAYIHNNKNIMRIRLH